MIRALGIGDNVCDKYRHLGKMFPGGQALNFAVYCRLEGHDSGYIGVIGSDIAAKHIQHILKELSVDMSYVRQYEGENGYAIIDLVDGERHFVTSNKGGVLREHPLRLTEQDISYISSFDIAHTSNNSYLDELLPQFVPLPTLISYDFSGRWQERPEWVREICRFIDFGFLSCGGLPEKLVKEQLEIMGRWGCDIVVATLGSRGAIVWDGTEYHFFRPVPVKAVDTLGSGDSMAAGFLMHYIECEKRGLPEQGSEAYRTLIRQALETGGRLAAKTCMMQGAFGYGRALA
jgi:fructoselysine 6-kinase